MKKFVIMQLKRGIPGLIFLFLSSLAFAQVHISGTVTEQDGSTLPGVSVLVTGTNIGTITNEKGEYYLDLQDSYASLTFSFVGYQTQEVMLNGRVVYDVVLQRKIEEIAEVVVVGYSVQRKTELTGALTSINLAGIESRRVAELPQALQGQVAGVQITQSTGAPGDDIEIRIRGVNTIGNNDPLFVIDGIPTRDIGFMNLSDIKSMTVLKDASAAAIYGSRAAAGVIVITTKGGEAKKSQLNIDYYNGMQSVANLPDMLNATQYMNTVEKAWNNANATGTNPYTADKGRSDFANTDWLDALFELGNSQNIQAIASGGNDTLKYLLSASYFQQDGIVVYDNDKYQRLNFRTNLSADFTDRLRFGTNLQLSYSIQDKLSSKGDAPGIIRHALIRPPIIPVRKSPNNPTYSVEDPFTDLPFYTLNNLGNPVWDSKYERSQNPIALAYFTDDKRKLYKTFGNIFGEYAFLADKELKFRTSLGIDLDFRHNKAFFPNFGDDDGAGGDYAGQGRQNRPNSLNEERGEEMTMTWNNILSYENQFNKHSVSTLAGSEYINNRYTLIGASRKSFEYEDDIYRYMDLGGTAKNTLWNSGSGSEWALFSLFASASYTFDMRYMFTANFRADASSRFAENNRWGYFPSFSGGWKISEENFMQDFDWLSDLKLRASWGKLGNQEIDNYAYLTLLRKSFDKLIVSRYGNPDLKWETTTQKNVGLDVGLFKNRIYFSADYFIKNTTDILLPLSLPQIAGDVLPAIVNAGEVSNKGFEFALNIRNKEREFTYDISANVATLSNEVKKLHPKLPNLIGEISRVEVGQPLNAYYGYVMEGIYQNQAEIDKHLTGSSQVPGDIRFKDLDGNKTINDKDRDFIGNPIPKLTYGLLFMGKYKGFDMSLLIQGVQDVDRYNDSKKILDYDTRPFNYTTNILNSWDGEGSTNSIPRVSFNDNGSSRVSSIFVEDASYMRLKNLEIGYSFKSLLQNSQSGIKDIRVYMSAQNVFTISDYTGLDPESVDLMDRGTFPLARLFMFGVNMKF